MFVNRVHGIVKDAIIKQQAAVIAELRQQIETLVKRIVQLEDEVARLKKNSHNSSRPPSSDYHQISNIFVQSAAILILILIVGLVATYFLWLTSEERKLVTSFSMTSKIWRFQYKKRSF